MLTFPFLLMLSVFAIGVGVLKCFCDRPIVLLGLLISFLAVSWFDVV